MKAFLYGSIFAAGLAIGYLLQPTCSTPAATQASSSPAEVKTQSSPTPQQTAPLPAPTPLEPATLTQRPQQVLAAEIAQISHMTDDELARESYQRWVYGLSPEECAAAPAQLELLEPIYLRDWAKTQLLEHWSSLDPEAAAKHCSSLRPNEAQAMMAERIASNWAEKNPAAAQVWAQSLKGTVKERALLNVCEKLALKDPAAALKLAEKEFKGQTLDDTYHRMVGLWSGHDFAAAQQWLQKITDPVKKQAYLLSSLTGYAQRDPESAASFVAKMPAADEQAAAAVEVAQLWAAREPAAAAEWISQFPAGLARSRTIETVMSHFAKRDPKAAHTWLFSLRPGTEKDAAIASFVRELVEGDIQTAPQYLALVADPLLRNELREMIQMNKERYGQ